jgi:hypothetical protein
MKKVLIFAAALSLLIPLTSCKKQAEVSLDVMSYNIRLGVADDGDNSWDIRKIATPAMLQANAPDIFGVQEAYDFQVAYIAEQCPQYVPLGVGREDGVAKGEHMSIFYYKEKIDVVEWGTYWLSETPDVPSKGWDAACYSTATWALLKLKDSGKQFYYHEIVGFTVVDTEKGELGAVSEVLEYPTQAILQIMHGKKEILIPILDHVIQNVDRDKKILTITAPEGLIDMYLQ